MQRYYLYADYDTTSGARIVESPDDEFGNYHRVKDVLKALAAKDRDLQEAAHNALMLEASAAAFQRVAEQRQGEIERLKAALEDTLECNDNGRHCDVCHTNIRAALKPTTGASND